MKAWRKYAAVAFAVVTMGGSAAVAAPAESVATASAEKPLLPVRVVAAEGKIFLTLPAPGADGVSGRFLYATALRTGLGSADMRLDKAANGPTEILAFRRIGKKVALTFENPRFRASDAPPAEQRAATDSFPFTTAWLADIASTNADGSLTIDIAPFLTKDVTDIAGRLNEAGKGFRLVESLSVADPASVKVFPHNIEMEAIQTFQSDTPGRIVSELSPDPRQVSFVVRHSLIKLPDDGYTPMKFDLRAGVNGTQVVDFATPLGEDVVYQVANRFRLEKVDPTAPRSRVKKPIVFYIDNAAPEPVRTALAEGVAWWADAFDAAGLVDAFQVKILPEGADPLDVRYNVVNWGNRLTRGWSFGQAIVDPRTGEIVKSSVFLGSLRVRQDVIIFEGLVGADQNNTGGPNDPVQVSLARIRQLGAHEVGHALGFPHNFAASTWGRASVMDYPGPLVEVKDGKIDLSNAYAVGIGAWDKVTVDWLYGPPAPGVDPAAAARAKIDAAIAAGKRFLTDIDGRAPDSPHPLTSMWDNGADPAAELTRMMDVRRVAIDNFGLGALRPNEPLAELRRKFVPVWLVHRYQVEAAAKLVGGVDYSYAVRGDANAPSAPVSAGAQEAAFQALLETLSPEALTVPDRLIAPLSSGLHGRSNPQYAIEIMDMAGGAVFDPLVAADVGAEATLNALLAPARLTRVHLQHGRDPSLLGLEDLVDRLLDKAMEGRDTPVGRRVAYRTVMTLAQTAHDPETSPDVAAVLLNRLERTAKRLDRSGASEEAAWSRGLAKTLLDPDMLERELAKKPRAPKIPPGMPIGGAETDWMGDLVK